MSHPVLEIHTNDGNVFATGIKYALGYDGANAEARELHGLAPDEYRLVRVGWVKSTTGLSGCGDFNAYQD